MTMKSNIVETIFERPLMLFFIAINCISSANARWAKPDHVLMPCLVKFVQRRVEIGFR